MKNRRTRISRRSFLKSALIYLTTLAFPWRRLPAAKSALKQIYIAPDDHTDYLWSADEATYKQAFLNMLDFYLDQVDSTQNNPADFQGRWNCDGSLWVWVYEQNRSPAQFDRLMQHISDGHITMPLNTLQQVQGGAPTEAILRGMYYAGKLERRYNLRFYLATSIENQVLPFGLGALWAGSGAKYSWKGICGCASRTPSPGDRQYPLYWWVGPDGSRILMKWYSMSYGNQSLGGYAEAYSTIDAINKATSLCESTGYPYLIAGAFGKGWDNLATYTENFIADAQSHSNSNRRVVVSNEIDFFQQLESSYGASLPELSCTFGNEWDLLCASMAEVTGRVRRSVEKLRSAEALATMVLLHNPSWMGNRQANAERTWLDLGLYWEHDWTADSSVGREKRAPFQRRLAGEIESYASDLLSDSKQELGSLIQKSGDNQRFFAFNPLSWIRTDIVDYPFSGTTPMYVVDLKTGDEAPSQIINLNGQTFLRVLAENVPAVGYKTFEIRFGSGGSFPNPPQASGNVIENNTYQITLTSRGAITSLIDKSLSNREFTQAINGRAINDLGAGSGSLAVENAGTVSVTLVATANTPLAHTTRISLVRGSKRIDIHNEITQNFSDIQTWAFSFNIEDPDVWHEELGAIIRLRFLADGGHYSPRNARYDWPSLNHFADMSGSGPFGITLSNSDCAFMKLGDSNIPTLDTTTPQISVLAGGQVDGTSLGIPDQDGDIYFLQRFALTTHTGYDPVQAMRFALEHQNPLVAGTVNGGTVYPPDIFSLLSVDDPNVLLWVLKPAEDGVKSGLIARLWNMSANPASITLSCPPFPFLKAMQLTHLETPTDQISLENGVLKTTLNHFQLKTFCVYPSAPALTPRSWLPLISDNK